MDTNWLNLCVIDRVLREVLMSRTRKVIFAAIAGVLLFASIAVAALPTAGGVYKGPTYDKGHLVGHVKLVAETRHKLSLARVKDYCGTIYEFHDVKVADDGTFKAVKTNQAGGPIFTIKGQFISRRRAKGSTEQFHCQGAITTWVAKRQ
jgi:hypothetical protein